MSLKRPYLKTDVLIERNYVTAEEAAAYLQISRQRLYNLTYMKVVPHYKFGKKLLLKKVDLDQLITKVEAKDNLWFHLPKKENTWFQELKSGSQIQTSKSTNMELLDRRKKKYR